MGWGDKLGGCPLTRERGGTWVRGGWGTVGGGDGGGGVRWALGWGCVAGGYVGGWGVNVRNWSKMLFFGHFLENYYILAAPG